MIQEFIIYKHTNKISGKSYIGYTCQKINKRWNYHYYHSKKQSTKFDKALLKYPEDSWNHEILIDNIPSLEEAKQKEIEMISKYDTYQNGYNSNSGGSGKKNFKHSEKTKRKISQSSLGKKKSKEHIQNLKKSHSQQKWEVIFPNGKKEIILNLKEFCDDYNLHSSTMYEVAIGKRGRKQHKGFKVSKYGKA
jgi:group I intron endonuclease